MTSLPTTILKDNPGLDDLAKSLGVSTESLAALGAQHNGDAWEFPERDAEGTVIGTFRRCDDGRKLTAKGSKRGLSMSYPIPAYAGTSSDDPILTVEGATDTAAGRDLGFTTIGRPGAAAGLQHLRPLLRDRHVVIVGENDGGAGRDGAQTIAATLYGVAASVRIICPPAGVKDLREWKIGPAGCDRGEVLAAIEAADVFKPGISDECHTLTPGHFHLTDLGNAERFVHLFGDRVRHCSSWGAWLIWDGMRWARDTTGQIWALAKETVRAIYAEASMADDKLRKDIAGWAQSSEAERRINAIVSLASKGQGVTVSTAQLDCNSWLLNVCNGTIDLRGGKLRPHDREDLITKLSPVEYDPKATYPMWDNFIADATDADAELIGFLQRAVGYSLTGDTREEVLFFVHGPAAAGKSTFVEAVKAVLGDYAKTADFETFLASRNAGGPRNDVARLAGARFVASIEVDEGKRLAEGLVKLLTGGDTVAARHLYRESFEFCPAFKLWLCANHAPRVRSDDGAMWRRILRVPFEHVVPEGRRDPQVKAMLRNPDQAGAAILAWAVKGCMEWQRAGLNVPGRVKAATDEYRADQDPLRDFLADRCELDPDAWAASADLRRSYTQWCETNGERPLGGRAFRNQLKSRACEPQLRDNKRGWTGVRLRFVAQVSVT